MIYDVFRLQQHHSGPTHCTNVACFQNVKLVLLALHWHWPRLALQLASRPASTTHQKNVLRVVKRFTMWVGLKSLRISTTHFMILGMLAQANVYLRPFFQTTNNGLVCSVNKYLCLFFLINIKITLGDVARYKTLYGQEYW